MKSDGLVERKVYAKVPPRVEYSLTKDGFRLKPILNSMILWRKQYKENHE